MLNQKVLKCVMIKLKIKIKTVATVYITERLLTFYDSL